MVLNSSWVSPTVVEDCARSSTVLEDRSTAEASCRTCGGDSARDLELNKVSTGLC